MCTSWNMNPKHYLKIDSLCNYLAEFIIVYISNHLITANAHIY